MCNCNKGVWNWEKVYWKITLYKGRRDEREVKHKEGGGCLFLFNNITHGDRLSSSMTILLYTLTPYWIFKICQKCLALLLYGCDTGERGLTLSSHVTFSKLINFRPYFEFEFVSSPCHPLPRFPLLHFLPSSLLLPDRRETLCQTVATLKYTDSSHRFSGYTRTGVNLTSQNLTANPNPVVLSLFLLTS